MTWRPFLNPGLPPAWDESCKSAIIHSFQGHKKPIKTLAIPVGGRACLCAFYVLRRNLGWPLYARFPIDFPGVGREPTREVWNMNDLVALALGLGLFALLAIYVRGCDRV